MPPRLPYEPKIGPPSSFTCCGRPMARARGMDRDPKTGDFALIWRCRSPLCARTRPREARGPTGPRRRTGG